MTKIEREVRRRERRRLADLNRHNFEVFKVMLQISLVALAIIIGITIWFWAAAQQAMEVEAAVLRHHRITSANYREIPLVEPLPLTPPEDGEPPQAIEVVSKKEITTAEAIPEERWESLGVWKTTGFCPCRKCNGKNAGRTASGAPMIPGRTVAVGNLPFGTRLKIDGKEYVVEDRGVHGHHVDILYGDHKSAWNHGVQYHEVFVLQ